MDDADKAEELTRARITNKLAEIHDQLQPRPVIGVRLCCGCSEPIAPARLAALPSAERCTPCQTLFERGYA